jgi:hypothetical protein
VPALYVSVLYVSVLYVSVLYVSVLYVSALCVASHVSPIAMTRLAVTVMCMTDNTSRMQGSPQGLVSTGPCRYFDEYAASRAESAKERREEELRRSRNAHPSAR